MMRAGRIAFALGASLLLASVWTSAQQLRSPQTKTTASEVQVAGDPVKGQAIFLGKGGCLSCHRVADEGSRMGPNLSGIATQRSARKNLDHVGPSFPRRNHFAWCHRTRDSNYISAECKFENLDN